MAVQGFSLSDRRDFVLALSRLWNLGVTVLLLQFRGMIPV
jgi:hypothetical protein